MCHYNPNTHNVTFCIFSCKNLNNFYKLLVIIVTLMKNKSIHLISNIMSKSHGIFTENLTNFFSNAGKTGNVPELKFYVFQEIFIQKWYKCNIYIEASRALDFKQLYIIYKFYPIKPISLFERIPYLTQAFNCSSQTQ